MTRPDPLSRTSAIDASHLNFPKRKSSIHYYINNPSIVKQNKCPQPRFSSGWRPPCVHLRTLIGLPLQGTIQCSPKLWTNKDNDFSVILLPALTWQNAWHRTLIKWIISDNCFLVYFSVLSKISVINTFYNFVKTQLNEYLGEG
jgi:hypothetical protein